MLKGILLVMLSAVCWGLGGVSGQYLDQYHNVDMTWMVMCRQILSGFMFLGYAALVQKQDILGALKARVWDLVSFSFIGVMGCQLGFYYTISLCNAATATVIQYTTPIYIMLWTAFKSRRLPEARELLGLVIAVTGVFLIATHGSMDSLAVSPKVLVIGTISALCYAYYTIKPVDMLRTYTSATVIGWGQLLSGLAMIAVRDPFSPQGDWDSHAYLAFAYLLFVATILCYALYLKGLPLIGPTKASLTCCAEPISSIICVVLLLDTRLVTADYLGMACIIFTVLLLSLPKK